MTATPDRNPPARSRPLPGGRAWWLIAAAFVAGLLLFLIVWRGKRDEFEFYRTQPVPTDVQGQVFEPLPAPLPAGSDVSEFDPSAAATPSGQVELGDAPVPPPAPGARPAADVPGSPASGPVAGGAMPQLLSAPPPEYPRAALRAGASGEVVLRIDVAADGRPASIQVLQSSRNRALDRAAVQAVQRWRFQPAVRDGVAVPGSVQQTIRFDAPR